MKMLPAAYMPGSGRLMRASFFATFLRKACGICMQDAGAVAGVDLAAAGAAMIEVLEDLDALLDDGVRFAALDVHDEADAAGVMLELRVIEALLRRAGPVESRSFSRPPNTNARGATSPRYGLAPITSSFSIGYIWRRGREGALSQSDIYESDHTDRRSSVNPRFAAIRGRKPRPARWPRPGRTAVSSSRASPRNSTAMHDGVNAAPG